MSPNHPINSNCSWLITSNFGTFIRLDFKFIEVDYYFWLRNFGFMCKIFLQNLCCRAEIQPKADISSSSNIKIIAIYLISNQIHHLVIIAWKWIWIHQHLWRWKWICRPYKKYHWNSQTNQGVSTQQSNVCEIWNTNNCY